MFVDMLVEGATPSTPMTEANLDSWINGLKVPFTTAMDADPSSYEVKTTLGNKETAYVIERASMKIVAKSSSILCR